MTTAHLQLMSKPKLIELLTTAEARVARERALADYWRSYVDRLASVASRPPLGYASTMAEARRQLDILGPDPFAQEHREVLLANLRVGGRPRRTDAA